MHFMTVVLVPPEVGQDASATERHVEKQMLAHFEPDADGWAGPESRFDYYKTGGNFDGLLQGLTGQPGDEPTSFWQRLLRRRELRLQRNSCSAEELRKHCAAFVDASADQPLPEEIVLPAALLTPDGTWHAETDVGAPEVSEEATEDVSRWLTQLVAILQEHRNCTAVALDCHI